MKERTQPPCCTRAFKPVLRGLEAGLLGVLILVAAGCKSLYSHVNRPLQQSKIWPDCRATAEIQQPRGEDDVLVILCLSGGGSRAAWLSAATMLRLERVVDEINLLHEVDVISSVSGGGLPAAYYCLTRDPGPNSVVRVEALPDQLPLELATTVKMDRQRGLLGVRGKMTAEQRDRLLPLLPSPHDQAGVERLFWLSQHTRAPAVWQPEVVRDLMTRNYIQWLLWDAWSPTSILRYWLTSYSRSDMLARILNRYLFGTKFAEVPKPVRKAAELEFLGWLDRCPTTEPAPDHVSPSEPAEDDLRWPKVEPVHVPLRLDWVPGYSPAPQGAQSVARDVVVGGVQHITRNYRRVLPYRFKDLNPERPYLILNSTDGSEDDPEEPHFGKPFPFTREQFKGQLNSSIDEYPVAWAVAASAAFPGVFSFVNLRDFRGAQTNGPARYNHVFDGGNSDNLGLTSAKRIILANRDRYRHFVVLLVDSHVPPYGARRDKPDVRSHVLGQVVDMNFLTTFGTLLENVRQHKVGEFKTGILDGQTLADQLTFWHITFDDVRDADLRAKVNKIPTTFSISRDNAEVVEQCVNDLIRPDHPKLQEFLRVLGVTPKTGLPEEVANPSPAPPSNLPTRVLSDP